MITINLLPQVETPRSTAAEAAPATPLRLLPQVRDPWLVGVAAAGALLLLLSGYGLANTASHQAELQALIENEVADSIRLSTSTERLDALEARLDTLRQKIQVIQSVDERRFVWPRLLDEVSRALPPFTWLIGLSSGEAEGGEGPWLTLQGNAVSTHALTSFMKALESSPFLREVTLVTSEQVMEEGVTVQRFTLEARHRRPEAALLASVPIVLSD